MSTVLALLECDQFRDWQLSLNSDATRKGYTKHLLYFCRFHNVKAQDLPTKSPEELKEMVKKYLLQLKKNAKTTSGRMNKGEIHVNSLPIYIAGVKSFIEFLEKPILWKKIDGMLPEQTMSEIRAYTREEIKKMLAVADMRMKAIMMIMLAGGARRQAVAQLKRSDFEIFDAKNNIGLLWVYPKARKWRYFTLLTPEATQAIQDYLKWREDHGEKITPEAPLIRDKFDVFTSRRTKPIPLDERSISRLMERMLERASIDDHRIAPDHSFRHFFDTMLINSSVDERLKKYWMGHKKDLGLDVRYYDPKNPDSRAKMFDEYMKAVDLLTIDETHRLQKQVKILEVKAKAGEKVEALEKIVADGAMKNDAMLKRLTEQEAKNQELAETVAMLVEAQKERTELERHKAELDKILADDKE